MGEKENTQADRFAFCTALAFLTSGLCIYFPIMQAEWLPSSIPRASLFCPGISQSQKDMSYQRSESINQF